MIRTQEQIDHMCQIVQYTWYQRPELTLGELLYVAAEQTLQPTPVDRIEDVAMAAAMGKVAGNAIIAQASKTQP